MTGLLAVAVAGLGVVDPEAPVFRADDEPVVRGTAAFETVRIRGGRPVLLARHAERLARSAAALRLPPPDGAEELALEAAAAAGADEAALRLFRTARTLVATVAPLPPGLEELRRRGLALVTVPVRAGGLLAGIKSTSYGANMAAAAEARARGADDALFVGEDGAVLEATTANVWWRDGDVLSTPALSTGVLPGVTRAVVAELAAGAGLRVREGTFALEALLGADEAFTSSAVRELVPVASVDGAPLRRGDAARRLQALLEQVDGGRPGTL
ncbi:MAG TPA: aminotransferase class IV [Gaiellaceae bacterium]|nr:aminotransferase class IV [Gaiellaceae bacterium]